MMDYTVERELICRICRDMHAAGWAAANDGNVSMRLSDGSILATPAGVSKGTLMPEQLVRLDIDGNVIEGGRPSSEIRMHLRCYAERGDVNGVVHAHPPTSTGFAAAHVPLDGRIMIETVLTLGEVPVTPYATPSTSDVSDSIAPYLADHDALLLANHGALTVASDVQTAFYRMETLEQLAKVTLVARQFGGGVKIPFAEVKKLVGMRSKYGLTGRNPLEKDR